MHARSPQVPLADGLRLRPLKPDDRLRATAVVDDWWGRPMGDLLPRPFFSEFRETCFLVERESEVVALGRPLAGTLVSLEPLARRHGRGLAQAAAASVEFKTDALNVRSRRALEALPAQFEGVLRKHVLVRGGQRRDSAYDSVIDDDWPEVGANLERRLSKHCQQQGETTQ